MIRLQPISTSDVQHYQFMEDLLIAAFPPEEYRELKDLREYTNRIGNFHNNIIFDDNTPGYGKKVLDFLCKELNLPIVLEVEMPLEEMAQRRINFYKRQGFVLWEKEYQQPPYKNGDPFLPMYLMVYGSLQCKQDFDTVKKKIHKEVYNVKMNS